MKGHKISYMVKSALFFSLISSVSMSANAISIDPGFDLFSTPEYSTTLNDVVINTGPGTTVTVPTFDVTLVGHAFSNWDPAASTLGSADTIVARKTGVDFNTDPNAIIPIELVALSLKSTNLIDLSGFGGPNSANLYITISGMLEDMSAAGGDGDGVCDAGETCTKLSGLPTTGNQPASTGEISNASGGTFDSFFDVFVDLFFVDVADPTNIITGFASDKLVASNTPWSTIRPSHYPDDPMVGDSVFLPAGGFYVAEIIHDGPHPKVISAVPEPATYLLFAAGLGLLLTRHKKKKMLQL